MKAFSAIENEKYDTTLGYTRIHQASDRPFGASDIPGVWRFGVSYTISIALPHLGFVESPTGWAVIKIALIGCSVQQECMRRETK